jgi:di/tricarboxylate transporter
VAVLSLLAVVVAGIVPAKDAFNGMGHPAVITVAAVLVISRGLTNAGIVTLLALTMPMAIGIANPGRFSRPLSHGRLPRLLFALPHTIGHQSCTLVMVPGGYRFGDYWRLGLPLSILVLVVAVPLVLVFWPL